MEKDPGVVDRKPEKAREDAIRKISPLRPGISAEWDPTEERVVVKAKEVVVVKAQDEAVDKAAAGNRNLNPLKRKGGDIMPAFDKTGPMGAGPMTGGARGFCNPANAGAIPAHGGGYGYGRGLGLRRGFRGGYGPGRGRGRGYGRGYGRYPAAVGPAFPVEAPDEMNMLKAQADYLKDSLYAVNQRIEDLEKKPSQSE
jgi:hypothetical protein